MRMRGAWLVIVDKSVKLENSRPVVCLCIYIVEIFLKSHPC